VLGCGVGVLTGPSPAGGRHVIPDGHPAGAGARPAKQLRHQPPHLKRSRGRAHDHRGDGVNAQVAEVRLPGGGAGRCVRTGGGAGLDRRLRRRRRCRPSAPALGSPPPVARQGPDRTQAIGRRQHLALRMGAGAVADRDLDGGEESTASSTWEMVLSSLRAGIRTERKGASTGAGILPQPVGMPGPSLLPRSRGGVTPPHQAMVLARPSSRETRGSQPSRERAMPTRGRRPQLTGR